MTYGAGNSDSMAGELNPMEALRRERKIMMLRIIVTLTSTLCGMILGFGVTTVPQLEGSVDQISWFASIAGFMSPVGSIFIGVMIDKFGRRPALLCSIAPSIVGWLLIWRNENMTLMLVGRAACGLSLGALIYPSDVYTAECILINHQRWLDSFKVWTVVTSVVGELFCMIMSLFLNYHQLAGVIAAISVIHFYLICLLLDESPIWFLLQNRNEDAERSRRRLGLEISPLLHGNVRRQLTSRLSPSTLGSDLNKIKREDVFKPLVATVIFFILISAAGPVPVTAYMINIIRNRSVTGNAAVDSDSVGKLDSLGFAMVAYLLNLLFGLNLCVIFPHLGLRRISIPCIFAMGAGMGVLAYATDQQTADLYTIRVVAVWSVEVTYNVGVSYLLGALLGYIFPSDCKGFGSIVSATFMLLCAVSVKLYPYLESYFHGYLYYGFMYTSFLTGIYAYFYLPETVGKSQKEISDGFKRQADN